MNYKVLHNKFLNCRIMSLSKHIKEAELIFMSRNMQQTNVVGYNRCCIVANEATVLINGGHCCHGGHCVDQLQILIP